MVKLGIETSRCETSALEDWYCVETFVSSKTLARFNTQTLFNTTASYWLSGSETLVSSTLERTAWWAFFVLTTFTKLLTGGKDSGNHIHFLLPADVIGWSKCVCNGGGVISSEEFVHMTGVFFAKWWWLLRTCEGLITQVKLSCLFLSFF